MIDFVELAAELANDEGEKLYVYDDATGLPIRPGTLVKGHPSIGRGRCLDTHGISKAESLYLNNDDMQDVASQLTASLPWFEALDSVRQTALANLTFNLGIGGLLRFHNTLAYLAAGRYDAAADELLATKPWIDEVGARGKRIAEMIRTGEWVAR